MKKVVLLLALAAMLALPGVAQSGYLANVNVPKLNESDDYTYAVCPSAVQDADGSLWLAVTVGRLVPPFWSDGFEQVRLYHYTDSGVTGEVVVDNRSDGYGGLHEECQLSLAFFDGNPLIAGTASMVPEGQSVTDRFGLVESWYQRDEHWMQYTLVGHSANDSRACQWSHAWMGDPAILLDESAGILLYWNENRCGDWPQYMNHPKWPGAPVSRLSVASVSLPLSTYLADVAWTTSTHQRVWAVFDSHPTEGPPWDIGVSSNAYPTALFGRTGDSWGPDNAWAKNPSFLRFADGTLAGKAILFESTGNLQEPADNGPVEFGIWMWGDPLPDLPDTVWDQSAAQRLRTVPVRR